MPSKREKGPAACHPNRAEYKKGLCSYCWRKQFPRGGKFEPEGLSPDQQTGADKAAGPKRVQIRYQNPAVAEHVAGVLVKNMMDAEGAAKELAPGATPKQVAQIASTIQKTPQIQKAVQDELAKRGLDDASKQTFIERMWEWMESGTEKRSIAAARLLGRAFISEKIDMNKVEELRIKDFASGVASMMGGGEDEAAVIAAGEEIEDEEGEE